MKRIFEQIRVAGNSIKRPIFQFSLISYSNNFSCLICKNFITKSTSFELNFSNLLQQYLFFAILSQAAKC